MELVANIWPIVDSRSQLIQRYAARAYAIHADDSTIGNSLKALATADYVFARQFSIPQRFQVVLPEGTLSGVVSPHVFNQQQFPIIETALKALEADLPEIHGVGTAPDGKCFHRRIEIKFPPDPYLVVTFLSEDTAGNLSILSPS
jgi:hypothetical protein